MRRSIRNIGFFVSALMLSALALYYYGHIEKHGPVDETKTVYIKKEDSGFKLYRNGRLFKIQGGAGNGSIELLSKIGGNTLRVYDTTGLDSILNKALEHRIAVIVDIKLPKYNENYKYYDDRAKNDSLKLFVKRLVLKHKDHPALLMWNLGNEIDFPLTLTKNNFIKIYNELIAIIHTYDPNHPVGTTLMPSQAQTFGLHLHAPDLDIIGFNVFGNIWRIDPLIKKVNYFTNPLPYYISENASNGPWEEKVTTWGAPLEPTSVKKAEQFKERYLSYLNGNKESLGNLIFYWGEKHERTPTWFSIFHSNGRTSEMFHVLNELWNGNLENLQKPPRLNYMLVENRGAQDLQIYKPEVYVNSKVVMDDIEDQGYQYVWEIYQEGWAYNFSDIELRPDMISKDSIFGDKTYRFKTPKKPGPYRLFVYVYDQNGNFSTTNSPFYILD